MHLGGEGLLGSLILPLSGLDYVETVTVIYSVEEDPVYWLPTRILWEASATRRIEIVAGELTLMEVLVGPEKSGAAVVALAYEDVLSKAVRLVPISQPILRAAARLRAQTGLRTPDAIHAATALAEGCDLFVTNAPHFRRVPTLNVAVLADIVAA